MTSERWRRVWDRWPRKFGPTDYARQVGKTVDGRPISEHQCQLQVADITNRLRLERSDVLLDLCCGNGLFTSRLSETCQAVVGVDFSVPLLAVAERAHRPSNVSYHQGSILELDRLALPTDAPFTKVLLYDALQHFEPGDLAVILRGILRVSSPDRRMLFGGVPYRPNRRQWYSSRAKVWRGWYYRLTGRDLIGTWWTEADFRGPCEDEGLDCAFHQQPDELYNSSFRFDVTIG